MRTLKISAQKKQPISILHDEKYLSYTALTLLNPNIVNKSMQQLWKLKYKKIAKTKLLVCLSASLPDHIHLEAN